MTTSSFSQYFFDATGIVFGDGVTQNNFSVQYTAWLTSILNNEAADWLESELGDIGNFTVKLSQNDPEAAPYIEYLDGGIPQTFSLDALFDSVKLDFDAKTGKVSQTRWYFDTFDVPEENHAPVAVADDNAGDPVTESGVNPGNTLFAGDPSAIGNVLTNDTDVDAGAVLTVAEVNGDSTKVGVAVTGTYGSVTIGADGAWSYALDNTDADTNKLAQGAIVYDVFNYTVTDEFGATSSSTLSIKIVGTNDAPLAKDDIWVLSNNTGTVIIPDNWFLNNDTDVDGDPLKIIEIKINGTSLEDGEKVGDFTAHFSDGVLTGLTYDGTPTDASNDVSITYTVSDGNATDEGQVTVSFETTSNNGAVVDALNLGILYSADGYDFSWIDAANGSDGPISGEATNIDGTAGIDTFIGGNGDDTLNGGAGADSLFGGSGKDVINGGDDDDVIVGGEGKDTLTGGTGEDAFVYKTSTDGGDSITDFDTSASGDKLDLKDVLDLPGSTWVDGTLFDDAVSGGYLTFTDNGGKVQVNVDITGGGDSAIAVATLTNINFAGFTAATLSDNVILD